MLKASVLALVFAILTTTAVLAFGSFSTTIWGNGIVKVHQGGTEHVSIEANDNIKSVKIGISRVVVGHTAVISISVTLNGIEVCHYNRKQANNPQTCAVGDLKTGDKLDVAIKFQGIKQGLDEWQVLFDHDNWLTPYNFAVTVLPRK